MPTLYRSFPWRTATIVVGAVAAIELVALLVVGGIGLAPSHAAPRASAARPAPVAHAAPHRSKPVPTHPLRPRSRVTVLVLNGNGVAGAASAEASRLQVAGYRIGGTTNAQRHDYARSMVLFAPGWAREARRLAHDAGVRMVAPVDGVVPRGFRASKLVLLLGT